MMLVVLLVHVSETELPVEELGDPVRTTQNSVS